jgi:methyl-accepting chemotaxis protein
MSWVFRPVTALMSGRNKLKQLVCGTLFMIPLAIALAASPPGWGAAGIAVLATTLLALYYLGALLNNTDRSWDDIQRVARVLSEHDLRAANMPAEGSISRSNRNGSGNMGRLYRTLVDIHGSLSTLVGQARRSAEAAREAADSMASGNVNLSQRTEEQASTLEETAAAMEQLSATVRENAETCRTASELVAGATKVARKGADVARDAVATMDQIEKSAKRIADIISVIDGIAFQTNILALNAAVEAARAGEQGRGFAVVASEVRSLAQRSAQAAREIKALIGDSVANVDQGTHLVHDAGRIINEVTASVEQVNELIGVIAIASREQSSGVESVNRALTQLQGATQQNAAVVQEAAYSAVTLKEEAGQLFELVGRYRIEDAPRPRTPAPAPAVAAAPRSKRLAKPAEEWQQF